jgi:hypothetical protein
MKLLLKSVRRLIIVCSHSHTESLYSYMRAVHLPSLSKYAVAVNANRAPTGNRPNIYPAAPKFVYLFSRDTSSYPVIAG